MKKIKLLLPLVGLSALASATIPLVSCNQNKEQEEEKVNITFKAKHTTLTSNTLVLDQPMKGGDIPVNKKPAITMVEQGFGFVEGRRNNVKITDDTIINNGDEIETYCEMLVEDKIALILVAENGYFIDDFGYKSTGLQKIVGKEAKYSSLLHDGIIPNEVYPFDENNYHWEHGYWYRGNTYAQCCETDKFNINTRLVARCLKENITIQIKYEKMFFDDGDFKVEGYCHISGEELFIPTPHIKEEYQVGHTYYYGDELLNREIYATDTFSFDCIVSVKLRSVSV